MFASTVCWARNCSHNPSELTTYTRINENEKPTIDISTQFFPVIQFPLSYNFIVHMFQNDLNILYWFIYFGMVVAFRSLCSIHLYLEDGSTKKNTYYYSFYSEPLHRISGLFARAVSFQIEGIFSRYT